MGQLEDRIAAVIRREVPCHPPAADRIAREVIRELELTEERATTDWPTPDGERAIATRVVSEWQHLAGCKCGWCVR